MYCSIPRELGLIIKQTLPVWVAGLPALVLAIISGTYIFLAIFTGVTIAMMIVQRTFSRYHYLPWIALLAVGAGLGVDVFLSSINSISLLWSGIFVVSFIWNLEYLAPYYLRPTHPSTLIRYEKFDQYLYLPHLSRQLKRLIRILFVLASRLQCHYKKCFAQKHSHTITSPSKIVIIIITLFWIL